MDESRKSKKVVALALVILLLAFMIYALLPYRNAIFMALIFCVLFRPFYQRFLTFGMSRTWAALLVIVLSALLVVVPIWLIFSIVIGEIRQLALTNNEAFFLFIERLDSTLKSTIDLRATVTDILGKVTAFTKDLFLSLAGNIAQSTINVVITYFFLYFLFVDDESILHYLKTISPFNVKNTNRILYEFKSITYATIIGQGIVAVFQGGLLGLGFLILGIPGALFWGIMGVVLSFLPIVGVPMIWIPAVIVQFVTQRYLPGGILLGLGLFISNADNFLRLIINKHFASLHPLISLLGVFVGLTYFGFAGIIIGPLLLSYFFLVLSMYREEFVLKGKKKITEDGEGKDST